MKVLQVQTYKICIYEICTFEQLVRLQVESWDLCYKAFKVGIETAVLVVIVSTRNTHPSLIFASKAGAYLYKDGKYKSSVDSAKGTSFLENIYTRQMFNNIDHRWQQNLT